MKTIKAGGLFEQGRTHVVASAVVALLAFAAASPSWAADRTISANYTLTGDETVDGVLTVDNGVTVDLNGFHLTVQ